MKRIEWIDSLKGLGIFLVTLGHLGCNLLIETYIYSFHMFLFFFISGFLHKNYEGNTLYYFTKKTKSLLIPFVFWNVASFFVGLLINPSVEGVIREFFLLDGEICWNAPIWFLLLLYMVEIVFFFIEKYIPYGIYISIPFLVFLWIFASNRNVFLKLNILPVCLLFYIFGFVFKRFYDRFLGEDKKAIKYEFLAAVIFCGVNILFGVFLNKRISFTGADFGNVIYCGVAAIAGVLFYITVFQRIGFLKTNKVLSYLGKNSLIIMATQYWFFVIYDIVSERLLGGSIWHYISTLKALAVSAFTIFLICAIVQVLKRISAKKPWLEKICIWAGINMS